MSKREQKIRTIAYIHIGEHLVDVDTLNETQRAYLAATLNYLLYSELYRGKADFEPPALPPREDVFADFLKSEKDGDCDNAKEIHADTRIRRGGQHPSTH